MKRKAWVLGLVVLAVPLWTVYGAGRSSAKPAAGQEAASAQHRDGTRSEPARTPDDGKPLAHHPHPGLWLGERFATTEESPGGVETASTGSETARGEGT